MTDANDETSSVPLTKLEHTLSNFDITTRDVLKTINGLKTNKSRHWQHISQNCYKKQKAT